MPEIFNNTMADLIYTIEDREIYNDIRSEVQVSETTTVEDDPGTPAGYDTDSDSARVDASMPIGSSIIATIHTTPADREADPPSSWTAPFATGWWNYGGSDYGYRNTYEGLDCVITERAAKYCKVNVTNNTNHALEGFEVSAKYRYKSADSVPPTTHDETKYSTLTVRAVDTTSISKYGRRVMNLSWPLGATEGEAQNMVNAYCSRYSEPVSQLSMTLIGSTDALKAQILTVKISDLVQVINSELGLDDNYFINSMDVSSEANRILIASFALEEARPEEESGFAMAGTATAGVSIIA